MSRVLSVASLAPMIEGLGYELVELEFSEKGFMRIYIDRPDHKPADREGGITVEDCAKVSNHLTHWFAVEGVDFARLEISSPGVDRPVRTKADFARFIGEAVKVRLVDLVDGRRNLEGTIVGVVDASDELQVECEGKVYQFPLALVDRARLNPELAFDKQATKAEKKPRPMKAKKPSNAKRKAN
jgi:ribosome maturation factor RimP